MDLVHAVRYNANDRGDVASDRIQRDGLDRRPALRASDGRRGHHRHRLLRAATRPAHRGGTVEAAAGGQFILSRVEGSDGVAGRYRALRCDIDDQARLVGRDPAGITLVGIGKRQSAKTIAAAIEAGLSDLGESYAQEAQRKFPSLPPVRKHFVGHLQTNKVKTVVAIFDVVQSVDRTRAGIALSNAALEIGKELPVLLQLNVSPSERFGCPPGDAERLAETLKEQPGLRLEGVMAIGPLTADRDAILRAFELAAKTLARIGGSTLSIGMSGDWREAVRAGSTMVRIGESLFGSRPAKEVG
ncbi:MAG: YggS family pyridoxal phosphate-dependent enzyme [Candidatus Eremiobacteraeota bacterium]|nr:YggS family pyridoxal phosphate-dependent enzyme [Candidatus Eremiobacteraeota bacterium]